MFSLLSRNAKHFNLSTNTLIPATCLIHYTNFVRLKHQHLDYSLYPKLNEDELEEHLTRGSGPGGQAVNKTSNCVLLRHVPTNILVKCHTHRLASRNRVEARKLLLEKLDLHYNGAQSIQAQLKVLENKKSAERKRRQNKLNDLKQKWQEREKQEQPVETSSKDENKIS